MGENSGNNLNISKSMEEEVVNVKEAGDIINEESLNCSGSTPKIKREGSGFSISLPFLQKLLAEMFGTFFIIFAGCGILVVSLMNPGQVSTVNMSLVWGFGAMAMVYTVGHISGAHFNPAATIAFATCGRFPWKHVPAYAAAQLLGSLLATIVLRLLFGTEERHFFGSTPSGSDMQAFGMEFVISFYLMFVISGVATDSRAIGDIAGLAIGAVVVVNANVSGLVSGSSMNPARSLGPAIIWNRYNSLWVYIVAPISGMTCGAWAYNLIRFINKPLREITRSGSFLKSVSSLRKISSTAKTKQEFPL